MKRGTELTHHITLDNFDFLIKADWIRLIIAQHGRPIVEYDTRDNDGRIAYSYKEEDVPYRLLEGESDLAFRLTEDESSRLKTAFPVEMEIRWQLTSDGVSDIDHFDLDPVPVGKIIDRRQA